MLLELFSRPSSVIVPWRVSPNWTLDWKCVKFQLRGGGGRVGTDPPVRVMGLFEQRKYTSSLLAIQWLFYNSKIGL